MAINMSMITSPKSETIVENDLLNAPLLQLLILELTLCFEEFIPFLLHLQPHIDNHLRILGLFFSLVIF